MNKTHKIKIHNSSAELPDNTIIILTHEQFKALWVALEASFQKAMNAQEIMDKYGIEMYYQEEERPGL